MPLRAENCHDRAERSALRSELEDARDRRGFAGDGLEGAATKGVFLASVSPPKSRAPELHSIGFQPSERGLCELWRAAEATLAPVRLAVAERAERYGARTAKRARDNVVLVVGGSAALEAGHRRPQSIARARDADTAAIPR